MGRASVTPSSRHRQGDGLTSSAGQCPSISSIDQSTAVIRVVTPVVRQSSLTSLINSSNGGPHVHPLSTAGGITSPQPGLRYQGNPRRCRGPHVGLHRHDLLGDSSIRSHGQRLDLSRPGWPGELRLRSTRFAQRAREARNRHRAARPHRSKRGRHLRQRAELEPDHPGDLPPGRRRQDRMRGSRRAGRHEHGDDLQLAGRCARHVAAAGNPQERGRGNRRQSHGQ